MRALLLALLLAPQLIVSPGGSLTIHKPRAAGPGVDAFNCPIGVGGGPLTSSVLAHWTFDTQVDSIGAGPDTYCDSSPNAHHLQFPPATGMPAFSASTPANVAAVGGLSPFPPTGPPRASAASSAAFAANFADGDWMVCSFVRFKTGYGGFYTIWSQGTNEAFAYTGIHFYAGGYGVPPPTNRRLGPDIDIDPFFTATDWNPPGDSPGDPDDAWFWMCTGEDGLGSLHLRFNDQPGLTCPDPVACEGGSGAAYTLTVPSPAGPTFHALDRFAVLGVQNTAHTLWWADGFGPIDIAGNIAIDEMTVFDHYLSPAEYATLIGGVGFTYAPPPLGPGDVTGFAYLATNAIKRYPFD